MRNFALSFVAIFAALDVIGTLPLYVSMTHSMNTKLRVRTVNKSMLVALIVALVFIFVGQTVFRYLGISISDFKIAGGLVLLLIALADLVGGPEAVRHTSSGNAAIVPLAVPLISGPGVLTTLILQVGAFGYITTIAALAANYLLAWILLRRAETVTRLMGKDGTVVVSKIAALLLTAIGVAMIRSGVFEAITTFSNK
ncbi:MAG: hypothetical protein A3K03_04455 [Bdellovibrionales bacterium RIFOXYD1_FULL_44_7]|nr:MAG: hypothetical protein A3K03_04455 [Bdellovibrionales bacterium RIFOXYD1_FULL_44_7]